MVANPLLALVIGLQERDVEIVDLTQPLSERTPVLQMPEPLANTPGLTRTKLSHFDDRGPDWTWNRLELGEHVGTHVDAPCHWISGQDGADVASLALTGLIAPVVVIDKRSEARENPDYLLNRADVDAWIADHGPLPTNALLLLRTGWGELIDDAAAFLGLRDGRAHSPGVGPECAAWLAHETDIAGLGVETVSPDAGLAATFTPAFPVHHCFAAAGKYAVTQLANLDRLPVVGSLAVVAPLKLVDGSGSPCRVFALVARHA